MTRFLLRGFRRPRHTIDAALGALERQVLEALWKLDREASVRDLRGAIDGAFAYTTLMTTVDRLYKKGLVGRRSEGRAYVYKPLFTRAELRAEVAADVIDGLLGEGSHAARPILSAFIDRVEARDEALLDELQTLIEKKRRPSHRRSR